MGTESRHLLGRFWLPSQPDRQLTGWLDLSGTRPIVTLNGQLTPAVEWKPTTDGNSIIGHPASEGFGTDPGVTIHGSLAEGSQKEVTIFNAITRSRTYEGIPIGEEIGGVHVLQGTWAVRGGLLTPDEKIVSASLRFTNLDEWINAKSVDAEFYFRPHHSASITYREPYPQTALVPTLGGSIGTRFASDLPSVQFNGMQIGHKSWIFFDNLNSTPESLLSTYVQPVLILASIMLNRRCYITEISITTEKDPWSLRVHHPIVRRDATDQPPRPGDHVINLRDVGIGAIARWIPRANALSPIPSIIYSAINDESSRTLESRLLELAAAAEGFDRRKHGDKESIFDKSLARKARKAARQYAEEIGGAELSTRIDQSLSHFNEPTYAERLHRLLDLTRDAVPGIAGNWKEWIKHVKEARNGYAHQLDRQGNPWEVELVLLESLRWILGAALLMEAGMSPRSIEEHFKKNQDYLFFKRRAKAMAPLIYGGS